MPFFWGRSKMRAEREEQVMKLISELCASPEYEAIEDEKVEQVAEIVDEEEGLVNPIIKYLKGKVKDENPNTEIIALEVLDKCMVEIGYVCQHKAKRKVLPRVIKMANPKKQYPSRVQDTAKKMIWRWADLYGGEDPQLLGYMTAYEELRSWGLFKDEEEHSAISSDILDDGDQN